MYRESSRATCEKVGILRVRSAVFFDLILQGKSLVRKGLANGGVEKAKCLRAEEPKVIRVRKPPRFDISFPSPALRRFHLSPLPASFQANENEGVSG